MAKRSVQFVCSNCGAIRSAWAGRCDNCGEWNTIQEEAVVVAPSGAALSSNRQLEVVAASSVVGADTQKRLMVGISDVDTVLGGGLVAGSVTLIAGQPGIGKSTLLLQISVALCKHAKVLYVSGEESVRQIGIRAERLGAKHQSLQLAAGTSAEDIAATILKGDYDAVVVDSIQTITVSNVASMAGTVSQITNSTYVLMNAAKQSNTAVILVGHVTKEGSIAGPKVLEHVVDVVLQLEGDRYGGFKILRSVVLATMEGSRPILVEVQALVNKTSYGYPKRTASGMELTRLNLLVAMLERRTKLQLADQDIYINIVGGIKLTEPAADLAVCMAIGSAAKGLQLKGNAVVFGEVGLSGEVRHVPFAEKRLAEAEKLGFDIAIGPKTKTSKKSSIMQPVANVRAALNTYLDK
jgi:DNA repair protein RadA/Sms